MFLTEEGMAPGQLGELVESRGFESLFLPEHTHIPAARTSPAPGGGELPAEYARTFDPFLALTAAAGATDRLLLGTGICLLAQRDPIVTAKEVATLDVISGGRFLFGVGAGWNLEEAESHGIDPSARFSILKEHVQAMKAIWAEEEASYEGKWVKFERMLCWPKPRQRPHPPVLVAGDGPTAERRVLAYGDEWLPVSRPGLDQRIKRFRAEAVAAGREPPPVTVYGARPSDVERYAAVGVHRCVFWLPARDPKQIRRRADELARELGLGR